MKLYRVHTVVKQFHGCQNVPFDWFGCDRREPRPYPELIQGYSPSDLDQEVAIDEMFTEVEAIALKEYLDREHGGAGVTTIEEVSLPIPDSSIGIGAIPVGGGTDFHMLDKEPNYSLPFKAWAYFDLRGCESHRSPMKRQRSLSELPF